MHTASYYQNARAVAWIILGMSCYSLYGGLLKELNQQHEASSLIWLSSMLVLLLVAPFALRKRAAAIRSSKPKLHLLRIFFNSISAIGTAYALSQLSLGEVTLYQLTTPIWLIPLALLLLHEKVRPMRWLGVLVGFAGVWIVASPDLQSGLQLAVLVALACAISDAMLGVLLKQGQAEAPLALLWWTYVGKAFLFGILAGFTLPNLSNQQWLLMLLLAITSIACMQCFVIGYRQADATVAETGSFSGLLIGPLLGWLMFGEVMATHFWLGAAVLVSGILLVLFEPQLRWPKSISLLAKQKQISP